MNKETLAQIILDFQTWEIPDLIERELEVSLEIPIKRAVTILGPRRAGKTYYLYSRVKKLLERGVERRRILYINFEDPKFINASLEDLLLLQETFYEIYPDNKNKKIWFFFDEIQNIKNWEIFIRSILDKEKVQIFISGSSSKLLSKEIVTSLRGRTLSYLLLPFSFKEFLKIKNIIYKKYLSTEEKAKISNALREYFFYGGYPETIIYSRDRKRIITEIIEVTIYRDLVERYNLRNTKVVRLMFDQLVKAKEFSVHKFYNFLKSLNIKVSKNSLYNYLEYFQDAFIFFPLRKFSHSLRKTEQSIPKIYPADNSFITNILGEEKGKQFENLVFLSLLRRGYKINQEIFYYSSNGREVDFIIKRGKKIVSLIQACFDISDYVTKERELRNLVKASDELDCHNLTVITWDWDKEEKYKGKKINFLSLWKWLQEE